MERESGREEAEREGELERKVGRGGNGEVQTLIVLNDNALVDLSKNTPLSKNCESENFYYLVLNPDLRVNCYFYSASER